MPIEAAISGNGSRKNETDSENVARVDYTSAENKAQVGAVDGQRPTTIEGEHVVVMSISSYSLLGSSGDSVAMLLAMELLMSM